MFGGSPNNFLNINNRLKYLAISFGKQWQHHLGYNSPAPASAD